MMSEWVRTNDLAALIEKHWHSSIAALARRLGFDESNIRRITHQKTKYTKLDRAEQILDEIGCVATVDIEVVDMRRHPGLFTPETSRAAVMRRWYGVHSAPD